MDPHTAAFTPHNDFWRLEMLKVQHTQADHAERLARLERRQDDDARMKSVWGTSSPFPGVLSGTPQQAPLHQPPADAFSGFDDHASLIGSLHLDAEDEPRRPGATSRANSVRFDESANQSHWSHPHRSSIDLIPRSGSSLSSHPMIERTYSHKSDGRQSSAGQSVHSATSGRANSLGIDTPFSGLGTSPMEAPAFAPGLFVLGSVPSIIRCWLNENFKHDSLLYAAVCTGSHGSYLDERLVAQLGYKEQVRDETDKKIKLPVYFPEATTRNVSSSRPSSPTPQLPSIAVDFTVVTQRSDENDPSIQIFIGSDVLRAHNGDVRFSTNNITLYDDDRCKLSIPMVRPENEQTFKNLRTMSLSPSVLEAPKKQPPPCQPSLSNGLKQTATNGSFSPDSSGQQSSPRVSLDEQPSRPSITEDISTGSTRQSLEDRSAPVNVVTKVQSLDQADPDSRATSSTTPSSIWGTWRRDSAESGKSSSQWAKTSGNYQRREQGIKVLRPTKSSRAVSATGAPTTSAPTVETVSVPATSQSRYFTDGGRRTNMETSGSNLSLSSNSKKDMTTPIAAGAGKTKSANPVGGASAFSWLSK
ncbi:uncharacterized protein PV09_08941 [Verruconis gallopava]|uniref:Ubiquitin carboxyl-terminal hydrolase 19 n=1 Tax=Verruconis gallopava TaxID=253628 RepID=A0A0D2AK96_9PEZI|nr:uncharacterized protein PV09_08941 [Verruconis gallopava]KIV99398.1 hypothetical protein PV09_08941 [Verruconis gallopava]